MNQTTELGKSAPSSAPPFFRSEGNSKSGVEEHERQKLKKERKSREWNLQNQSTLLRLCSSCTLRSPPVLALIYRLCALHSLLALSALRSPMYSIVLASHYSVLRYSKLRFLLPFNNNVKMTSQKSRTY